MFSCNYSAGIPQWYTAFKEHQTNFCQKQTFIQYFCLFKANYLFSVEVDLGKKHNNDTTL